MISGLSLLVVLTGQETHLLRECLGRFIRRVLHLVHVLGLIERARGFRRHVVLVVLGHDLIGVEGAVRPDVTLRDATPPFLEKVGKDSFVHDWNGVRCVSHRKVDRQSISVAFQRPVLDQAADAKCLSDRRLLRCDLRRAEKEDEIISKRPEYKPCGQPDRSQASTDKDNSFVTLFHKITKPDLFGASRARGLSLTSNQHQHLSAEQDKGYAIRSPDVQRVATH